MIISNEDMYILKATFHKFDKDHTGRLSSREFVVFLEKLSQHVKELPVVDEKQVIVAFEYLKCDVQRGLTFDDFVRWWERDDKYDFFTGEKASLLRKAYNLFLRFSDPVIKGITYSKFEEMMDELKIEHAEYEFDTIDNNDDGVLNFYEFCKWLKWF